MTSDGCSIPLDLMFEILLKLPAKSVLRFRYVSKSWCSIINSQQFIDAFMSLSLSRPRLLFVSNNYKDNQVLFFSSPHLDSSFLSSSSMLLNEKYSLTLPELKHDPYNLICNSVRGFVCWRHKDQFVVYNLTTRQVIHLTEKNCDYYSCSMYLGYDPNSDQYKVMRIMSLEPCSNFEHSVCTLEGQGPSHSWRTIKAIIPYYHRYQYGVCIDGVVYYQYKNIQKDHKIGSFDVGSELLRLIETPEDLSDDLSVGTLTNYMGKLAVYCWYTDNGFRLWILDDVKNQGWSNKTHVFQYSTRLTLLYSTFSFEGITDSGEIVLVPVEYSDPFDIICCDMEKKMERRVTLDGLEKFNRKDFSLLCSYVDNIVYL